MKLINENCYKLLSQIPEGKVTTYKIIADLLGVKSYRYIGKIIGQNMDIIIIPCHRVVLSSGGLGGFRLGVDEKRKLLLKENIPLKNDKVQTLKDYIFNDFKL
jgi:methylated-DNA-[protein]-cysteine S-methyltransferase